MWSVGFCPQHRKGFLVRHKTSLTELSCMVTVGQLGKLRFHLSTKSLCEVSQTDSEDGLVPCGTVWL